MTDIIKNGMEFILPLGGICVFFWGVWQYYHSQSLDVFHRYCDRYNKIVTPEVMEDWCNALQDWPPNDAEKRKQLELTMLAYLNLVWEEFYLRQKRMIPVKLWDAWRSGIDETIQSDFAKSVLKKYREHFSEFDPESKCHKIAQELGIKSLEKNLS